MGQQRPAADREVTAARTRPAALPVEALPTLSPAELARYGRHLVLPDLGLEGQRRLRASRVLVVGAGGLGSPLAMYLAAAGVGRIGLVDFDAVELSNLQRQLLHGTADVGRSKLESARDRLADINPHVDVALHPVRLSAANALDILVGYDVVVDGTDNFPTRYLTNDACVLLGIPNVYGSIFRFEGQVSVFATADGPCYRCVYPQPPPPGLVPSCAEGGVLGVLPGLIGTLQATEVIKLLAGIGDPLVGRLLLVDALGAAFRTMRLPRDPACPACGTREIRGLIDYDEFCGMSTDMPENDVVPEITPRELAARLAAGEDFDLIDVREPHEWEIAHIDGARLVPLGGFVGAAEMLAPDREVIVMCRSGVRSATAVRHLQKRGFRRAINLAGGILRWSDDVDPSVPRY